MCWGFIWYYVMFFFSHHLVLFKYSFFFYVECNFIFYYNWSSSANSVLFIKYHMSTWVYVSFRTKCAKLPFLMYITCDPTNNYMWKTSEKKIFLLHKEVKRANIKFCSQAQYINIFTLDYGLYRCFFKKKIQNKHLERTVIRISLFYLF